MKKQTLTTKQKAILIICACVLVASSRMAQAQPPKQNALNTGNVQITSNLIPIGCEGTNCAGLTIDNTAGGVPLTASKYNPTVTDLPAAYSRAQVAICINIGAKIWVTDNSTITLATGRSYPILDGGQFTIYGFTNISNFKAIRDAAVNSLLFCNYYRQP